jgi:hypothetical protein
LRFQSRLRPRRFVSSCPFQRRPIARIATYAQSKATNEMHLMIL